MNIDDRARRAADDLAAKAVEANMPALPEPATRRFRPAWAFAAGAAVVVALILVPLVFLGGPRDDTDPAVTTLPPVTAAPSTTMTTDTVQPTTPPNTRPPVTGTGPPSDAERVVSIEDLASAVPPAASPQTAARFSWARQIVGDNLGSVHLSEKGFGPCCFDVAHDGTVVVLDSARQRLVAEDPTGAFRVIAEWDSGDFVPDAMVIAPEPRDDVIFVLGMTNRPGRPHDLISLKLDGTVIERAETIVDINVEMLESAGSIWATSWESNGIGWIPLATEVGDIFDLDAQIVQDALLLGDRGRMAVEYVPQGTGIIVHRTDPQGVTTRFEVDLGGETWGHFAMPFGDGLLVWASTSGIDVDGSVDRVVALLDGAGDVVDGFTWLGSQWAEIGPFGITRLGPDGAIYDLYSTETGVGVRRFPLSRAGAFDALVARAALGRAMVVDDRTLWIAGPYQADQRGEWGEILQVDLRSSKLVAVHEVSAPMNALAVGDGIVWAARAGDGGLPANTLARIERSTGSVAEIDLGSLSTNDLAATDDGVWILAWAGGDEVPSLAFVSNTGTEVGPVVQIPTASEPRSMQLYQDVLWIASLDGRILRYDLVGDVFLEPFDVGFRAFDILVEEDLFGSDLAVWVTGLDGDVVKLRADGAVVVAERIDSRGLSLSGGGAQGTAWAVSFDGGVYFLSESAAPLLIEQTGASVVNAMVFDGGRLWVLGDTLEVVEFGQ